jgi:uncharacterized membrane protein YeiH
MDYRGLALIVGGVGLSWGWIVGLLGSEPVRWWRFLLLLAAVLIAAAASTVLAIAVSVATGGTAHRFPLIEHHPWWWSAGATMVVAGAALLVWWAQRIYERRPVPPQTSTEARSAYGRLAKRWDLVELGVHQVIGGGLAGERVAGLRCGASGTGLRCGASGGLAGNPASHATDIADGSRL